jgi:hypothetical protein
MRENNPFDTIGVSEEIGKCEFARNHFLFNVASNLMHRSVVLPKHFHSAILPNMKQMECDWMILCTDNDQSREPRGSNREPNILT